MPRTYIKISGITSAEDAAAAVEAGADALGLVFADSPHRVTVAQAKAILEGVPLHVARIGVFVDAPFQSVYNVANAVGLTAVQYAGNESPLDCDRAPSPPIKVIRIGPDAGVDQAEAYRNHATALLFDTSVDGLAGGDGHPFDWRFIAPLPDWIPVFVAGGLTAENVGECIAALHPYAVDVSTGVEKEPGVKDPAMLAAFCAAVRAADAQGN